jgi:gamma-glutamylputrescine oxidase
MADRVADPMVTHWGRPPWRVDLSPPAAPLPARCDVAVVGGGFTGLSAAYHLARRGAHVVLLEASMLAAGASGRTGGIVLEGTAVGPLDGVEHCLDALAGVVAEAEIDCDLRLPGCWELVHRDAPDMRPFWRDCETWLCIEETVAGGTIDPGALVAGLARAAIRAGATLHEQAAVHGIEPGQPLRLRVGNGSLLANRALVALNAYTTTLLAIPVRLTPALTLAVCTDTLEPAAIAALGLSGGSPFYTLDLPYLWGRMTRDGRLVLGAGLVMNDDRDVAALRLHSAAGAASLARLEARIAAFHPALAGAALRERWGGPIAFTPDRTPVLSRLPGAPNVIVSAGCAGHGIALGVRVGQLVAGAFGGGEDLPAWGALPGAPVTGS